MRTSMRRPSSRRNATVAGLLAVVLGLGWIGWLWAQSLVPATYSVMSMGVPDYGGGPQPDHAMPGAPAGTSHTMVGHDRSLGSGDQMAPGAAPAEDPAEGAVSVVDLAGPSTGRPDVSVTLTARKESFTLADGRGVDGYTLNGTSPGPTIEARQGDLVQVDLVNENIPDGATLHWHGVNVPNAEDGVAGVTQDAVPVGGQHVYRFVAQDAGTYWYHSHNVAHRQVTGGLFGVLVVHPTTAHGHDVRQAPRTPGRPESGDSPADPKPTVPRARDVVAAVHSYDGVPTVNGRSGVNRLQAQPAEQIRLRVVNTDSGPLHVALSVAFRVVAIDGGDLVGPDLVRDRSLDVPAGGRADVQFGVPGNGSDVRAEFGQGGSTSLVIGPLDAPEPQPVAASEALDLLSYGSAAPLGFDPTAPDRRFRYEIGRRPGFVDGRPGLFWTINGRLFPDVPMFMVAEGDVVVMTLTNTSGEVHPMHLHGHKAVVLSRNGVAATGSPWWVDSLDVGDGERYELAFLADNPGIWMDHCHNLPHAAEGLVAHLMYENVTTPFVVGGDAGNQPE